MGVRYHVFSGIKARQPAASATLAAGLNLVSFEKCRYESYLAFRGVGGKKPDEGRGDWARRYLTHEDDPIPLGDSIGKLYSNSLSLAHQWSGLADEARWSLPETFDEYMDEIHRYVSKDQWSDAEENWDKLRKIIDNHLAYQRLFSEFDAFLDRLGIQVVKYEDLFTYEMSARRLQIMDGLSRRSTIPNEDFEIASAALFCGE